MMPNVYADTIDYVCDLFADEFKDQISTIDIGDGSKVPAIISENSLTMPPDFPYITVGVVDSYIPQSADNQASFFSLELQFKIVGDEQMDVLSMARQMYRLLWRYETTSSLNNVGISFQNATELPNTVDSFDKFIQFTSGWSCKFMVNEQQLPVTSESKWNLFIKQKGAE